MNRLGYWDAHSDRDWEDPRFDDRPLAIGDYPDDEELMAEQERDMAEIDAERAREERRRVLEEAAMECEALARQFFNNQSAHAAFLLAADNVRALIDRPEGSDDHN